VKENFFNADDVSFVGRPFAVNEAGLHFARLKRWGYNTIRYIFTWEAIEHAGPGKYDEDWIEHTINVLRIAKDYGFHVFMDPHQDVVSEDYTFTANQRLQSLAVVSIHRWFWRSLVDSLCMWS